ncbi:MAG: type II toxin-antitoxin system RelB/DinJ family antitoxin [Clostridia bacterium]|nr:type II toxin-antitoxin system RelB/DinJ family antitoxin [Clostridia bacterium]MBO5255891.1 type II toxin-antitoxin system RelB/DinJ family antitoxin [Clostridia bacterium]MBP3292748.1 type II toxin-antitoxin system RelB/DinJ family antitoxin [Clostridia bacterium]MBQ7312710.1 type II toxin-antitoxin system RelB/DinJ family antitoxin [Clostridia bacterium]
MAKTETLHVRVDPITKQYAEKLLGTLGLSTAEAINIFLHQVVLRGGLPFSVTLPTPNAETLAAMQETRDIASGKVEAKAYHSVEELMEDLLDDADD